MSKGVSVRVQDVERKYTPETHPVVSVDLDGTIWEERYPYVSKPYENAIETLNAMLTVGYQVILWTARGGKELEVAVDYLGGVGLRVTHPNFFINTHAQYYLEQYEVQSPKANANVFLDDKGYGAPVYKNHWGVLYKEFIG